MRIAMGTFVAIEAAAPSEMIAATAIEAAFAALAEVEQRMHPSRGEGDVARINAAPPGVRTPIHASTAEVLRLALLLNTITDGAFDPCLPVRPGRFADLELGESPSQASAWVIARAPLALDLGGIAKGYAIDCAVEALREGGCSAGTVNAGGDLRLFGDRPETILVRRADGRCRALLLSDAALAVSDLDEPRRPPEHRGYYIRRDHGVCRETAAAVQRHAAVVAPDAMRADALTKCVLLCPEELARRALAALGGRSVDPA
jgi:thiamine biosynthesis lipoprotein